MVTEISGHPKPVSGHTKPVSGHPKPLVVTQNRRQGRGGLGCCEAAQTNEKQQKQVKPNENKKKLPTEQKQIKTGKPVAAWLLGLGGRERPVLRPDWDNDTFTFTFLYTYTFLCINIINYLFVT